MSEGSLQPLTDGGSPVAGWQELAAGGIEVVRLPGDHYSVVRRPIVAQLAEELAERLAGPGGEA
jgi:thioesterase domain-containing protein